MFTADQVRSHINSLMIPAPDGQSALEFALRACDIMAAYADHLEQDEQLQQAFAATEGAAYAIVPHGAAEAIREEARREILAEMVRQVENPIDDFNQCFFCEAYNEPPEITDRHNPNCLWLRAQSVPRPGATDEGRK